jgi:hypothetical protein
MKKDMSTLGWIAFVLVIVGALNWLLVGLFKWNLVQAIFGGIPIIEDIIYVLVGISALYLIFAKR